MMELVAVRTGAQSVPVVGACGSIEEALTMRRAAGVLHWALRVEGAAKAADRGGGPALGWG